MTGVLEGIDVGRGTDRRRGVGQGPQPCAGGGF